MLLHRLYVLNAFTHTRLSKQFLSALEKDFATVRTVGCACCVSFTPGLIVNKVVWQNESDRWLLLLSI